MSLQKDPWADGVAQRFARLADFFFAGFATFFFATATGFFFAFSRSAFGTHFFTLGWRPASSSACNFFESPARMMVVGLCQRLTELGVGQGGEPLSGDPLVLPHVVGAGFDVGHFDEVSVALRGGFEVAAMAAELDDGRTSCRRF